MSSKTSKKNDTDFFKKKFWDQMHSIICSGDLTLVQAIIGVRNANALLMYCASYYITKVNVLQIKKHADIMFPIEVYQRLLNSETEDGGESPEICDPVSRVNSELTLYQNEVEGRMKQEVLLPQGGSLAVGNQQSSIQEFVREGHIGSLCVMDERWIEEAFKKRLTKAKTTEVVQSLSSVDKAYLKAEVEQKITQLENNTRYYERELKSHSESLNNIKNGRYLDTWYRKLLNKIIEEAARDKDHLFHGKVNETIDVLEVDELTEVVKHQIRCDIISIWNGEVLKQALELILGVEETVNKRQLDEQIMKLVKDVDVMSDRFIEGTAGRFEQLKSHVHAQDNSIRGRLIRLFRPSLLVEAEHNILTRMLREATFDRKPDVALLLICNSANSKYYAIPEENAFTKIKEIYKDMPPVEDLPGLSLNEILAVFPESDPITKIAHLVKDKKKELDVNISEEELSAMISSYTPRRGETDADLKNRIRTELETKNVKEATNPMLTQFPFWIRWYYFMCTKKYHMDQVERARKSLEKLEKFTADSSCTVSPDYFFVEFLKMEAEKSWIDMSLSRLTFDSLKKDSKDFVGHAVSLKELSPKLLGQETPAELDRRLRDSVQNLRIYKTTQELIHEKDDLEQKLTEALTKRQEAETSATESLKEKAKTDVTTIMGDVTVDAYDEMLGDARDYNLSRVTLKANDPTKYLNNLYIRTILNQKFLADAAGLKIKIAGLDLTSSNATDKAMELIEECKYYVARVDFEKQRIKKDEIMFSMPEMENMKGNKLAELKDVEDEVVEFTRQVMQLREDLEGSLQSQQGAHAASTSA